MEQLKLFHVSTAENLGYDSYSDFIICCESEEVARNTQPGNIYKWWKDESYMPAHDSWVKPKKVKDLEVAFLGIANPQVEEGVLCSSFNAG